MSERRAVLALLTVVLAGCNGLSLRKADGGSVTDAMQSALRLRGPGPATREYLNKSGIRDRFFFDPAEAAEKLGQPDTPEGRLAVAELHDMAGREAEYWSPSRAINHYLQAAYFSSEALLADGGLALERRADAVDLYNRSVERFLRRSAGRKLLPDDAWERQLRQQDLNIAVRRDESVWAPDPFDELKFADDYIAIGVPARQRDGLGVRMLAVRKRWWRDPDRQSAPQKFFTPVQVYPVTVILRFLPNESTGKPEALVELHDPIRYDGVQLAGYKVPLAADFTTPLVYQVTASDLDRITYLGFFDPQSEAHKNGLYLTHPYEPGKIPVILIHGLWSSPKTWTRTINDLRADPAIRSRYQFWTFQYTTGNPFISSAAQLRECLREVRAHYDPDHRDAAFDQMVLFGHSMGGLIAKIMITQSDDAVWKLISSRPFAELKADEAQKEYFRRTFFFEPNPSVKRVVFIATPHRGSMLGNNWIGQIGDRIIRRPNVLVEAHDAVIRNNGDGFFTDTFLDGVPSSVRLLKLHSPLLQTVNALPYAPNVPRHSIIARIAPVKPELSSDGVVPYESSHLADVASEKLVIGSHACLDQSDTIEELRRILLLHIDELDAGEGRPVITPAVGPN
jgi:pimeloyl-ACP methyl ester carboxylesterase